MTGLATFYNTPFLGDTARDLVDYLEFLEGGIATYRKLPSYDMRRREEELQRLETLVRHREEEPAPLNSGLLRRPEQELQRRTEDLRSLKVKAQRRKEEVSRVEGLLQRKDEREKVRRNSVGLKRAEELVRHLEEKGQSSLEERTATLGTRRGARGS